MKFETCIYILVASVAEYSLNNTINKIEMLLIAKTNACFQTRHLYTKTLYKNF